MQNEKLYNIEEDAPTNSIGSGAVVNPNNRKLFPDKAPTKRKGFKEFYKCQDQ